MSAEQKNIVPIERPIEASSLIAVIERAATNQDIDISKMERLLEMHERITQRSAEQAFSVAMSEVQSKINRVSADSNNAQTKSKYASYAAIDRALRPIYTEAGFSLSFDTGEGAALDWVRIVCSVSHKSGHTRKYHIDMPADGKGAKGGDVMTKTHATGSATAYGMRYLVKMIFNVAIGEDDDDGNNATGTKFVTEDQIANIEAVITEVNADRHAFLRYMQCKAIAEIRADEYQRAITALEAKRKAVKK